MASVKFTPLQKRILKVLSDGMPHSKEEIRNCLDELATDNNLWQQLHQLKKKLFLIGQWIVCESIRRGTYYRHVILLSSQANEKLPTYPAPTLKDIVKPRLP